MSGVLLDGGVFGAFPVVGDVDFVYVHVWVWFVRVGVAYCFSAFSAGGSFEVVAVEVAAFFAVY